MKRLLTFIAVAASLAVAPSVRADEITRFLPMKAEQLNPEQKKWADLISAPPRNAKFVNPPYRAYLYNPDIANRLTAMSEYLRWNTSLPPRLSELAILITARHFGIIGYYDLVSMTLITMQAGMPDDKVTPLPALTR